MNAIAVVEDEARELVRRRGLDPAADSGAVRPAGRRGDRGVRRPQPDRQPAPAGDLRLAARQVFDVVAGFGPLQKYLDDPTVEEIWINERPG